MSILGPKQAAWCLGAALAGLIASPARSQTPAQALVWDAELKEHTVQPGEQTAKFSFSLTNVSPAEVTVRSARTSCGCSIAKMPAQPWVLASGASGQIEVSVDLRGKSGVLMKSLSLDTTVGPRHVVFKVNIPGNPLAQAAMADRLKNQQLALADRQAVFKGDCARCHAEPARGRTGGELFAAACVICHDTPHRASMVPDLYALNKPVDAHYWRTWISFGREGSLMPAFAQSRGGPLTDEQIASVVEYLITNPLRRAPQVRVIPAPLAPTVPRPASPPPQPPAAPR